MTLCFGGASFFYPFVGWVLGGLVAVLGGMLTALGLPPTVAAALTLCGWIALTGALHLDGLMDTADGIFSHRSRERMLEIMKDSRVGAMGVIACVLLLLIKWSLLSELLGTSGERLPSSWPLVSLAPLWSRWFMVAAIVGWPYARASQSGGLGGFFSRGRMAACGRANGACSGAVLANHLRLNSCRLDKLDARRRPKVGAGVRLDGRCARHGHEHVYRQKAGRLDRRHVRRDE